MKYDSKPQAIASTLKALIDFDYKQVIDQPNFLVVTLSNSDLSVIIKLDKRNRKVSLSAYNKTLDIHHNDKILFLTISTFNEIENMVITHINKWSV